MRLSISLKFGCLIYISALFFATSIAVSRVFPCEQRDITKSNFRNFLNSAVSGAISCSLTHSAVCPLDVLKTKIQTDAALKGKSTMEALRSIVKSGGKGVLLQGLAATFSGYAVQGFCKFGFYESIKLKAFEIIQDKDTIDKYRLPILLVSSGLAEIIASWALCPMEVTRIFMVMNPQLKSGMLSAMKLIIQRDGPSGLFKGLPMIMLRQVPYTCAKLAGYEIISDNLKKIVAGLKRSSTQGIGNLPGTSVPLEVKNNVFIQLSSGVLAGVLAATISHPADVLLSKVCGATELTECLILSGPISLFQTFKDLGFRNCYAGLQPRAVMIGSLTAMQFILYEQAKSRIQNIRCTYNNMVIGDI
jgi:solute carrier family 25 (mitochondrial phosphate transporter), member 3